MMKKFYFRTHHFEFVLWFKVLFLVICLTGQLKAQDNGVTVSGQVTDLQGSLLPGVTVVQEGTTNGTITNNNGSYTLEVTAKSTLVFSFVGMISQRIPVNQRTNINVVLIEETIGLEEVVVIGYGTQSRRTITTAITKVTADKIENVPVTSVSTALQGKLSGVRIFSTQGGQPGADASILVRGGSSINKSNDPLVIVDGMIRALESVQVLKDASSTAIYGSRASNGVVLVTTKRG